MAAFLLKEAKINKINNSCQKAFSWKEKPWHDVRQRNIEAIPDCLKSWGKEQFAKANCFTSSHLKKTVSFKKYFSFGVEKLEQKNKQQNFIFNNNNTADADFLKHECVRCNPKYH